MFVLSTSPRCISTVIKVMLDVINILIDVQAQGYGGVLNGINLGEGLPTINIQRTVGLPELRRLRRTFVKLTGQTSLSGPPPRIDAQSAKRMFADYLNQELGTT
ncbi:protein KTI12 homolog [Cryptomeria japonica]|uniref:protein KTI12 homolog n=1 Tax=Cryptomeria japonica TaxID=3369 RepID=UPI0027DA110D|nr:protein KTI12 homolog [Cryptomeria japonica]